MRPGLCSASGRKLRSPCDDRLARDADGEGRRGRGERVLDVEAGQAGQRHRHVDELDERVGVGARRRARPDPAVDHGRRAAAGRRATSRIAGESGSRENTHGWALITARIAKTRGSSALRTAHPLLRVIRGDDRLHLGELVDGVDALQAQVVGGDVGDDRDVVAGQADALEQDAAAGGLGDGELDRVVGQHAPGPAGSRVVAGLHQRDRRCRCRRCWTSPTSRPSVRAMWAIIRLVVVLPLVPVTATTGTRGVIVCGPVPRSRCADPRRRLARRRRRRRTPGTASSTSATARPITCARSRCRHG